MSQKCKYLLLMVVFCCWGIAYGNAEMDNPDGSQVRAMMTPDPSVGAMQRELQRALLQKYLLYHTPAHTVCEARISFEVNSLGY